MALLLPLFPLVVAECHDAHVCKGARKLLPVCHALTNFTFVIESFLHCCSSVVAGYGRRGKLHLLNPFFPARQTNAFS